MSFKEAAVQGFQRNRNQGISTPEKVRPKYQNNQSNNSTSIYEEQEIYEPIQWGDPKSREEETVGFQEKEIDYSSPFEVKNMRISGLKQKLKFLAVSQKSVLAITDNNQVLRWKFDSGFDTYETLTIPEKKSSQGLGGKLATVGGKIGGKIIPFKSFKKYQNDKQLEKEKRKQVDRVYMDRGGDHCLICNNHGYTYYINHTSSQVKYLSKMKRFIVKSVNFDDRVPYKTLLEDKIFLFGSENSSIYQCKLEYNEKDGSFNETIPQLLLTVPDEKPRSINDIRILYNKSAGRNADIHTIVIASTNSQIYFFQQTAKEHIKLEDLFRSYEQVQSVLYTLPTPVSHLSITDLCYEYDSKARRRCRSYIYTNGSYLQYYKFPESDSNIKLDDNFFRTVNYFNYGESLNEEKKSNISELNVKEMPQGVGITLFHYIILHSDSISVLSQITQQVVFHENLTTIGKILGMVNDMENKCYWIYGEYKIVRLFINNELEQAWRIYLEKQNYEKAYQLCKKIDSPYIPTLSLKYADQLFDLGKYIEAARIYLESSLQFEEVFVKFQGRDLKIKEGLAEYVKHFLQQNEKKLQDYQISILVNWLADFYIHRVTILNQRIEGLKNNIPAPKEFSRDSLLIDMKEAEEYLQKFMSYYKKYLVEDLIYDLMSSYGQLELCLKYALEKENYSMVISNYIHSERYKEVISVMKSMQNCTEYAYKYSDILMKKETKLFIDLLKNHIQKYDPSKMMRSLMEIEKETEEFEEGFQFIKYCITEKKLKDQIVHNIYIFFLSEHKNKDLFTEYMIETENKILNAKQSREYFDMNFAFNLAKAHKLHRAIISLLAMRKLFEESVEVAIQNNMINVAIEYAQKSEEILMLDSHKTWIKIIEHHMKNEKEGTKQIEKIFSIMEQCGSIKIEDVITYFDNNLPLSLFKGQIEESVRSYQEDILELRNEIDDKNEKLEELKSELNKLNGKYMRISEKSTCYICSDFLLNGDFVTFPCEHNVHQKCSIELIQRKHLYEDNIIESICSIQERIQMLRRNVRSYDSHQVKKSIDFYTDVYRSFNSPTSQEEHISRYIINFESDINKLKSLHKQLDTIICKECSICGPSHSDIAFTEYKQDDSWNLD